MLAKLSSSSEWQWRLRFDLDVVQRCLFVVGVAMAASAVLNALPACLGLWAQSRFVEFWMTVAVVAAVAKSAAQLPVNRKSVLITGCDTGFGKALAKHLHGLGFEVFAGCLLKDAGGAGAKELAAVGQARLHVLQLDVTKESDWVGAKEYIDRHVGDSGLWGIVNNAGWATYGEVEWVQMDTYRKIWEINVLGVIRGVQLVLPLLRKSKGRVVSITSGLARMAVPTRSPYVSSKYAIEGFSDCLRYEMEPFGVHVSVLEPGNFIAGTNIFNEDFVKQQAEQMKSFMSEEVRAAYGEDYFQQRVDIMRSYMNTGVTDLRPVIEAYTNALLDVFPQKRYQPMNLYFKVRCFIATHLPEIFYDKIYIPNVTRK